MDYSPRSAKFSGHSTDTAVSWSAYTATDVTPPPEIIVVIVRREYVTCAEVDAQRAANEAIESKREPEVVCLVVLPPTPYRFVLKETLREVQLEPYRMARPPPKSRPRAGANLDLRAPSGLNPK